MSRNIAHISMHAAYFGINDLSTHAAYFGVNDLMCAALNAENFWWILLIHNPIIPTYSSLIMKQVLGITFSHQKREEFCTDENALR